MTPLQANRCKVPSWAVSSAERFERMKKYVPLLIVLAFGGIAYFVYRRNKTNVADTGVATAGYNPPPVLRGFTGTSAVGQGYADTSSGPIGFTGNVSQTSTTQTNTSGGFSGTAAKSVPQSPLRPGQPVYTVPLASGQVFQTNVPPVTQPVFAGRSGRSHF